MIKVIKYILVMWISILGLAITNVSAANIKSNDYAKFTKPSDSILQKKLSKIQYEVTQKNGTEISYKNEYRDNHIDWIYVDIVSGEPLFSSMDKYDSKTWRPSFTKPISSGSLTNHIDNDLWFTRTEVRSKYANSHLWHLFDDWPKPDGNRYCINSASLKFISKKNLKKKWYSQYIKLFK